jgi:hypothetical protein
MPPHDGAVRPPPETDRAISDSGLECVVDPTMYQWKGRSVVDLVSGVSEVPRYRVVDTAPVCTTSVAISGGDDDDLFVRARGNP